MKFNGTQDEGAEALSEVLRVNRSLIKFNLRNNDIENKGVGFLYKALEINETIVVLDV